MNGRSLKIGRTAIVAVLAAAAPAGGAAAASAAAIAASVLFLHIDNDDMTYLNLTLSIMAEVQGVVLLIYTSKIAKQQDELEEKIDELDEDNK